jgi:hypothetical protein
MSCEDPESLSTICTELILLRFDFRGKFMICTCISILFSSKALTKVIWNFKICDEIRLEIQSRKFLRKSNLIKIVWKSNFSCNAVIYIFLLTSHDSLYEETKWEKLKDRRNNHKLVLFHKMNCNITPQYLAELIPKTVGTWHTHNTRQINNIVNMNCRTSLYSEYFLPSTVKAWNDLPLPTRNC